MTLTSLLFIPLLNPGGYLFTPEELSAQLSKWCSSRPGTSFVMITAVLDPLGLHEIPHGAQITLGDQYAMDSSAVLQLENLRKTGIV
jgi:hypothetical protein